MTAPFSAPTIAPNSEVDPTDLVHNQIPVDFTEAQVRYLTYRVFDFNQIDSCNLMKLDPMIVVDWRRPAPDGTPTDFAVWEDKELPKVRKKLQVDLTLSQFYRNMWYALQIDGQVLGKGLVEGIDKLSHAEQEYLGKIRARYSPDNLLAMLKIATGDLTTEKTNIQVNTIYIAPPEGSGQVVEGTFIERS